MMRISIERFGIRSLECELNTQQWEQKDFNEERNQFPPSADYSIIMNSTLSGLSDAVTEALGTGLAFAGFNETGRVIPATSSRACGAWHQGQHNLFQAAEMSLIIGSLIPHRYVRTLTGWLTHVVCGWATFSSLNV